MGDEIKPVTPVIGIQPELPARVPEKRQRYSRNPHLAAESQQNDGYDLSGITTQQAQTLLAMPLMEDHAALANTHFAGLKEAISRRAESAPAEQGDLSALITASVRVSGLMVDTYSLPKPGEPAKKPTSSEMRSKITEFDTVAASFGKERPIMRG
jgi:hypothetical protein